MTMRELSEIGGDYIDGEQGGSYFAFLKILKIAVHPLKDIYSGMPKIGLKKFLVKTQKSAGLSRLYLVNSLSVCSEFTSKLKTWAADFGFQTLKRLFIPLEFCIFCKWEIDQSPLITSSG